MNETGNHPLTAQHSQRTNCPPRSRWRGWPWLSCLVLVCAASTLHAQPANDPLKVQRGAQGMGGPAQPVVQQQQQPFYLQAIVVVLLSGGAVWAVCHSSRRQ